MAITGQVDSLGDVSGPSRGGNTELGLPGSEGRPRPGITHLVTVKPPRGLIPITVMIIEVNLISSLTVTKGPINSRLKGGRPGTELTGAKTEEADEA